MENNKYSIGFNAKITPIKPLNEEMTLCKCYVLALGKNRNLSCIDKDAVELALPSIYNIPVVGHIYVDDSGQYHMGGHDMALVQDGDGKYLFKPMTVPYGVVPSQDNIHFEDIMDSSGNINTYQVADVILWTGRYPELKEAIYNDQIFFGQSMEIRIVNAETMQDGEGSKYTAINEFTYSALCLLGKSNDPDFNVEPCFPDARVEPYQFTLSDEFYEGMEEFKKQLSICFSNEIGKGGENKMTEETRNLILAEAQLTLEDLDFELVDDMTEEEFKSKVDKIKATRCSKEDETDDPQEGTCATDGDQFDAQTPDNTPDGADGEEFSLTYNERFDKLASLVGVFDTCDENGITVKYHRLFDFDATYAYLIVEDWSKSFNMPKEYARIMYVCADGGEISLVGNELQPMIYKLLTVEENEKLEQEREEYIRLLQFKEERLELDKKNAYQSVLDEFSDLANNEDFLAIVKDAMQFENTDSLKNACYAVRGKAVVIAPKQQPAEVRIPITNKNKEDSPYGGFFNRYLPTAESQNK